MDFQTFSEEFLRLGTKFKNVVILDARKSTFGQMDYKKVFSDRYFDLDGGGDVAVGQAAGFALSEKIPVLMADAETYLRAVESIRNVVCEPSLNVKLIGVGEEEGDSVLKAISGLKVMEPEPLVMLEHYGPTYIHLV